MKLFCRIVFFVALCLVAAMPSGQSEDFTYNGTNPPLQTTPSWAVGSSQDLYSSIDHSGNTITINMVGGTNPASVFGGGSDSVAVVEGNTVDFINGTVTHTVYGGYGGSIVGSVSVMGNKVNIATNAILSGTGNGGVSSVYGGYAAGQGAVGGNSVAMTGGLMSGMGSLHGGYSNFGEVFANKVEISDGTIGNDTQGGVWGGLSTDGKVFKNEVVISGGTVGNGISGRVYGGNSYTGEVSLNSVTLEDGTIGFNAQGVVYGGYGYTGDTISNTVVLDGTTVGDNANGWIYGGFSNDGGASKNRVEYKSGTIASGGFTGRIYGGYSVNGDANENKAVMSASGGSVTWLYGGRADTTGTADGNSVEFSDGTVNRNVYGGYSVSGSSASSNEITLSGTAYASSWVISGYVGTGDGAATENLLEIKGGQIGYTVVGGRADSGAANENRVTISDGNIGVTNTQSYVYGGSSESGEASGNAVTMTGGTVKGSVGAPADLQGYLYGGFVRSGNGNANDNIVHISGTAHVATTVTGGQASAGNASGNEVRMSAGSTTTVYGGFSSTGIATKNNVFLENATLVGGATGGYSGGSAEAASHNTISAINVTLNDFRGGVAGGGIASFNTADFYSGTAGHNDSVATLYGGWGYTGAHDNTLNIYGGDIGTQGTFSSFSAYLYGGHRNQGSTDGVYNNTLNIYGGQIGTAAEFVMLYGGEALGDGGEVYSNTINISGGDIGVGNVTSYVYGGYHRGASGEAVHDNTIIVSGGSVDYLFGGVSNSGDAYANRIEISGNDTVVKSWVTGGYVTAAADASDNVVAISGSPDLTTAILRGWNGSATTHSGNTLEIHEYGGTSVQSIGNFEIYDFLISTSLVNGGAALTVTDASDISDSTTTVNFVSGGPVLQANDQITLVNNIGVTANNVSTSATAKHGALLTYDLELTSDANNYYAGVRSVSANSEAKSMSAGRIGSLAFLNQGQDVIAEKAFDAASVYLGRTGDGWSTPTFFGVVGGGHFRHKTGSHVDVDGISTLLGLTWRNNGPCGSLLFGAFFEAGYADYDTRNTFASGAVRGDGDTRYFGGGFLARYDWQCGVYAEATGRVGGVKNKFASDLTGAFGNRAKYDIDSAYFGAHAGVGYKWQLNGKALLDLSTKYLWSRQNSDTAIVTGTPVHFDANNSHRWRTGARFAYAINDCFAPYVGAAFEYEFNGKAKAGIQNMQFGAPTLKGGTGIGEIGFTMRRDRFSADLGVQGHIGRRDGVTGTLRVGWSF